MQPKLIALDLDGTLYTSDKRITERTRSALMESGARLMIASARPVPGLYHARDALELQRTGGILMAYNGGRILEAGSGRELYSLSIPMEDARALLALLERYPVTPIVDDGVRFYVKDPQGYKVGYECMNNRMECEQVTDLAAWLSFAPAKLLLSVEPTALAQVQAALRAAVPSGLSVVQTAPFYLEVIPSAVSKGTALRRVCERLGLSIEETVAFGDSGNDIPMLEAAGIGVAMGNGTEAARAAADMVTTTNDEDGIALALERIAGL